LEANAIPMHGLLERQAAMAELAGLTRSAGRGAGCVVLLRGEAGAGKTALIAQFVAALDPSWGVLRGWCDPLAVPRPLGPLIDALEGLGAAAASAIGTAIQSGDIAGLYARLLAALRGGPPRIWVIEDAHWADGATLDLMRFVARRICSLRLLLVVSYRDEIHEGHPLSVALGDLASCESVHRIKLEMLSREAVAALASGSGVNADELYRLSGGNPFYVTEVLGAGADALRRNALPCSVTEAVWGRLARLSAEGRDIAYAAAICGPGVKMGLMEKVCPGARAALPECLRAGVLVADGDVVGFRHELARRAALEQIPDLQQRMLHKRALTALAESPLNPDMLAALAFHADEAGDADAVIRHAPAAAERAAALGANREAAQLYALVLRHAGTVAAEQRVRWVEQHAFTSYLCGLAETAVSSWREAIELRRALGDPLGQSDNLRWLSHELWGMGRVTEAFDAVRAALRLAQDAGSCPQLGWSLANLAEFGVWGFDPAAVDHAAQAISLGTRLGDHALVIRARGAAAMAQVLSNDTGWEQLEAAWRDAMATEGHDEHAGLLATLVCWLAVLHYDVARADRYISDSIAYCGDHNLFTFEALVIGIEAMLRLYRGDWDCAGASAEEVLTRPGLAAVNRILPQLTLALIHARRGRQPVVALLDDAATSAEPDHLRLFSVWAARAEAAWLAGDDDTARIEAQAGLAATPAHADPWLIGPLQRWLYLTSGEPTRCGDNPRSPFELEIRGDWQAAAEEWMRRGCLYDAGIAQMGGDITAVKSALATFRKLGARAAARRAQQRLAALRGRTPTTRRAETRSDPDGLTRRQRQVLGLIAQGHSDMDIAGILHISPRTVHCHVSSILRKLGVENRIQAAAHAARS
jgi:DNA-binding CsgD family transcriptional regulator